MTPVHKDVLRQLHDHADTNKGGLNVNAIYRELVTLKIINRNKKPVIAAIHFLEKGHLIETIMQGEQKEIKMLTSLGRDLAKMIVDLDYYRNSCSALRNLVKERSNSEDDFDLGFIGYLTSPYEVTNVMLIRYISVLSKIRNNEIAKTILNDIIMNKINDQLSNIIVNPADDESFPHSNLDLVSDKIEAVDDFMGIYDFGKYETAAKNVLYSLFDVLDIPINFMKEIVRNAQYLQRGLQLVGQTYLIGKIKERYGLSNLHNSIGLQGTLIMKSHIPAQMESGSASKVSVTIRGWNIKHTSLKLLVVDPNNKQLWFADQSSRDPDPLSEEEELRFDGPRALGDRNRSSEWMFDIPSDRKTGQYRALILLYEEHEVVGKDGKFLTSEGPIIDCEEHIFQVVTDGKGGGHDI